ncbi:hypothetical protein [Microbacterium hominis]|uniref:hypothetical protein n=1 Tax=Microbacterium hominis TaxID=162426 RepID=UPI000AB8E560|nr:hypothetical protein [Microbacterium hominis]
MAAVGAGLRAPHDALPVAATSTEWNYWPGWERALLERYGIDADAERMSFSRDLWNAT